MKQETCREMVTSRESRHTVVAKGHDTSAWRVSSMANLQHGQLLLIRITHSSGPQYLHGLEGVGAGPPQEVLHLGWYL